MKTDRIPTIRSTLALLVTACVLPALLMAVVLISYYYQHGKNQLVSNSIMTARALMFAIDKELANTQATLLALATSPHLDSHDIPGFYAQAKAVLRDQIDTNIVLTDASGQQHINTRRPLGEPLPNAGIPQVLRTFATGKPTVSDLFIGPVTHRPLVAIAVPVRRGDAILYSLSMGMDPERLANVLVKQRLPPDWIGAVFDRSGSVVARTHEMERFVGLKGASAVIQRMTEVSEDAVETDTREGIPVIYVFSRSTVSNWSVAIGIPRKNLTRELWHSLWWIVLATFYLIAPLTVKISASIGIAVYPDAASTFETLLRRADEAMYKAKTAGKQRFAIAAK